MKTLLIDFRKPVCLFFLIIGFTQVKSQTVNATRWFSSDKSKIFSSNAVSVWGDLTINGITEIAENGQMIVYSGAVTLGSSAQVNGAGLVKLIQPRPSPYAASVTQTFSGGYTLLTSSGASVPDLAIDNPNNVQLVNSDLSCRDTFNFINGKLIIGTRNISVGNTTPGVVLNYTENKYFVTNADSASTSGFLERKSISTSSGNVVFPIGSSVSDYTPGAVQNTGTSDHYKLRVFNNTYESGNSGVRITTQGINKTWELREAVNGGSALSLSLQHNSASESSDFSAGKNKHFVSHYVGVAPNNASNGNGADTISQTLWNLLSYSNLYAGESGTGYLTTSTPISSALVTIRNSISVMGYYSKTTYSSYPLPVEVIRLSAEKTPEGNVVSWATSLELNNNYFTLYKMSKAGVKERLAQLPSKAVNGNSNSLLLYSFLDQSNFLDPVSCYYLEQTDFNGDVDNVGLVCTKYQKDNMVNVYPNPATNFLNIRLNNVNIPFPLKVSLYNYTGQKVMYQEISEESAIDAQLDLSECASGLYYICIDLGENNLLKQPVKIVNEF